MNLRKLLFAMAVVPSLSAVGETPKADQLTPEKLLEFKRLGAVSLSPNEQSLVFSVSEPILAEDRSNSDLYRLSLADGKLVQLTKTPQKGEYNPTWIQGGTRIAYLASTEDGRQLFTMKSDGSDLEQITQIPGGIEDYLFSPDEKSLLYVKSIKYGQRVSDIYPDLPKASGRLITDLMYKHWDEWVESVPHLFLAKLEGDRITSGKDILEGEPYEAPMKPFGGVDDVAFTPDGSKIAYVSRKKVGKAYSLSTNSDIYLYDINKGTTVNLTEGMMGYDLHPRFSPDGRYMAFISQEHDGYESDLKRLFVLDLKTGQRKHLNEGWEYDVEELSWAPNGKDIYYRACYQAETHLWKIQFSPELMQRGKAKITQLTNGVCNYSSFLLGKKTLIATRQSMATPKDIYRVDLRTGAPTQLTELNKEILASLAPITIEKRWITTTDGGKMLTWVVKPPHFDPNKKYPALLYCQGGPQNTISQNFSYRWNARLMADQGYVVVMPNRHGVPGFGKAWNEQISGDYSGQNIQDYLTAIDELAKEPWVDEDALGAVGASYGGYSVYYLAGVHEGRFKAFVAHAGILNLEMQYVTTEEMWFANWDLGGAPWEKDNATAQRTYANSPHKLLDKWDTPILVIHGELDFRILASQGMAAYNAAQLRGIPSELLIYPDENHWIMRPQNSLLWHRTFFRWLDRWLKKKETFTLKK